MRGKTHIAAGAVVGAAIATAQNLPIIDFLLITACSTVGGLLPDVDIGTSKIAKLCAPAARLIQFLFGHRGMFHSLLLWAIPGWLLLQRFPNYDLYILSACAGILSHLVLDMLNPTGVPLLWPVTKKISLMKIHTGGIIDKILAIIFTCVTTVLLCSRIITLFL